MMHKRRVESMFGSRESWGLEQNTPEARRDREEKDQYGPWHGFLILQCAECGRARAFNAKQEIYAYKCGCGAETPLENLKPLYLRCKCGAEWRYKTNLQDETTEHKCIRCGNVVKTRLNGRKTAYVTYTERWY